MLKMLELKKDDEMDEINFSFKVDEKLWNKFKKKVRIKRLQENRDIPLKEELINLIKLYIGGGDNEEEDTQD